MSRNIKKNIGHSTLQRLLHRAKVTRPGVDQYNIIHRVNVPFVEGITPPRRESIWVA